MPKYIGRLAQAEYHPGTAVLRDITTGTTFFQLSLAQAKSLMGGRKEVYYLISIRNGAYHLDQEIPPEELSDYQTRYSSVTDATHS